MWGDGGAVKVVSSPGTVRTDQAGDGGGISRGDAQVCPSLCISKQEIVPAGMSLSSAVSAR